MRMIKELISKKCLMCGRDAGFTPNGNRRPKQSRARKFCSQSCSAKFLHKDKIILISCPICKKQFRKYPENDGVARKHCSMKCFNQKRSANLPKYEYPPKEKKRYRMKKIQGKQILYHRWVMQQHLGRKLARNEHVHHINNDPQDNRLDNLQLLTQTEHNKLHREALKILP